MEFTVEFFRIFWISEIQSTIIRSDAVYDNELDEGLFESGVR